MQIQHHLRTPRSGKTLEIIKTAYKGSLYISTAPVIQYFANQCRSGVNVLSVGSRINGLDFSKIKKVFIDELFNFKSQDIKWLQDVLLRIPETTDIEIYSTPYRQFSKEVYLLAKYMMNYHKGNPTDVLIDKPQVDAIQHQVQELHDYFLLGHNVTVTKNTHTFLTTLELEKQERNLGDVFNVMYKLEILK